MHIAQPFPIHRLGAFPTLLAPGLIWRLPAPAVEFEALSIVGV